MKRVPFDRYGGPSEMYLGDYDGAPVKSDTGEGRGSVVVMFDE